MAQSSADSPESREIRVFLSSTFSDFMEERDLLVKQVFPDLRRKARERGVEIVDVDLRWGITEEQSRQGKVIPICLGEIDRCRPYFIGMLGERYGWIPALEQYSHETLGRQPWLKEHIGGVSVTELEILHGVLNNPDMAGHAFFYFRDPAWSRQQNQSGFISASPEEQARLTDLKKRILCSSFPVTENLADPAAIATAVEQDLWAVVEREFPELDLADDLEREEHKHSLYRHSRCGVYIDSKGYIGQLDQWIKCGKQRILITGESGAGKSALIANWVKHHQQCHPRDVLYCHHLGCTSDANALGPMLVRMIQSSSRLLLTEQVITQEMEIPSEWWELVAQVAETLQTTSRWCRNTGRRWIWVLDGLDRLSIDEQRSMPWLPLNLPPAVHVLTSALACPAREILKERNYTTLIVGPLVRAEQEKLINHYLQRYTKEMDGALKQYILDHPLVSSPLFLLVLLEELRQCGRFETLRDQLGFYLSATTIDGLYKRVLDRLENDGNSYALQKAMTAIWASRAGLSENELLEITGLAPLEWAPINLALEASLGRNGTKLVFHHDFLRQAVQDRYLSTGEKRRQAHGDLADWYAAKEDCDSRSAEELPWQLQEAGRKSELRSILIRVRSLYGLTRFRGHKEIIAYWLASRVDSSERLDELIAEELSKEIQDLREDDEKLIDLCDHISSFLSEVGLYSETLLKLRKISLQLALKIYGNNDEAITMYMMLLADAYRDLGFREEAARRYEDCLEAMEKLKTTDNTTTRTLQNRLGIIYKLLGDNRKAGRLYKRCLETEERLLGPEHPSTLAVMSNLAMVLADDGDYSLAESYYKRCLEALERVLGPEETDTLHTVLGLGSLLYERRNFFNAQPLLKRCFRASERLLGSEHPLTIASMESLGHLLLKLGHHTQAKEHFENALEVRKRVLGPEHPMTLVSIACVGHVFVETSQYDLAEAHFFQAYELEQRILGESHPNSITSMHNLGRVYRFLGDYERSEAFLMRCLQARERQDGADHPGTLETLNSLAVLFHSKNEYGTAEGYYKRCLTAREECFGPDAPLTLVSTCNLGVLFSDMGDYEQAECCYRRALASQERLLGADHPDTKRTRCLLTNLLSGIERYDESIALRRQGISLAQKSHDRDTPATLSSIKLLADDLYWTNQLQESEQLYREALEGSISALGSDHPDTMGIRYGLARCLSALGCFKESIMMRRIELAWCQRDHGVEPSAMLVSMHGLGCDLLAAGETEEALEVLTSCLGQRQQELGEGDDDTLGTLARALEAYSSLGRQREGLALSQEAQDALTAELGENHPKVLTQLSNQATLHDELGELEKAEALYRRCLHGREQVLGADNADTLGTVYNLADVLSQLQRRAEAIPLRRRDLAWCREQNGDTDPGTLTSINGLAIDLRETGELEEAEALFRELVSSRQQVLEPDDFEIGRALGGLAKTLERVGKLEEAIDYSRQAVNHRLAYEGPDTWWTNLERLDLAKILHKLDRSSEALQQLNALQTSIESLESPDDDDRQLLDDALSLRKAIETGP